MRPRHTAAATFQHISGRLGLACARNLPALRIMEDRLFLLPLEGQLALPGVRGGSLAYLELPRGLELRVLFARPKPEESLLP